jgi:hypothetical protein
MTYSNAMALGRQRSLGRNQNAVSFHRSRVSLGPISNSITLVVLACLLGLLYLTQVTKTNAYGYTINSLQQQQTATANQYNNLEVNAAQLQSASRTQNSSAAKSMVAVVPSGSVQN